MRILLSLAFAVLLSGCGDANRYEMSKDTKGRTVRLDKKTGEIAIIGEDRLTVLKGQAAQELEAKMTSSLEEPKIWPPINIPQLGDLKVMIATSWRDEKMAYRFSLKPLPQNIEDALKNSLDRSGFTVVFHDNNGFKVTEIHLPLKTLSRNINEKGESLGLSANDSIGISSLSYIKIAGWEILWNF